MHLCDKFLSRKVPEATGQHLSPKPCWEICCLSRAKPSRTILPKVQASPPPSSIGMCQGAPQLLSTATPPVPSLHGLTLCGTGVGGTLLCSQLPLPSEQLPVQSRNRMAFPLPLDSQPWQSQAPLEARSVISFQCVLYCFDCLFCRNKI